MNKWGGQSWPQPPSRRLFSSPRKVCTHPGNHKPKGRTAVGRCAKAGRAKMVPSDPLDGSLPDRHARSKLVIRHGVTSALCSPPPVLAGCGSKLCACPLSVPVEACFSMRPFTLLRRSLALRQVPAAGSTLLACIFETALESPLVRSASHSRPRPAFCSPGRARSLRVARCQLTIPEPSACLRTSAPLQDFSILRDHSTLPVDNWRTYHRELPDLPSLPAALQ